MTCALQANIHLDQLVIGIMFAWTEHKLYNPVDQDYIGTHRKLCVIGQRVQCVKHRRVVAAV